MDHWKYFHHRIEAVRKELGCSQGIAWYRGVSNSNFRLTPKAHRREYTLKIDDEADIYSNYVNTVVPKDERQRETSWGHLAALQHNGAPTRLLDWTEVLGVAIFFAVGGDGREAKSPCVWIMNPFRLAKKANGKRFPGTEPSKAISEFDRERQMCYQERVLEKRDWPYVHPVPYRPPHSNGRIAAQRGFFTVHGSDRRALDKIFRTKITKKVILPRAALPEAYRFLDMAGINHTSLFPDLGGYIEHVNRHYTYRC